jgi:hypothetical protein
MNSSIFIFRHALVEATKKLNFSQNHTQAAIPKAFGASGSLVLFWWFLRSVYVGVAAGIKSKHAAGNDDMDVNMN